MNRFFKHRHNECMEALTTIVLNTQIRRPHGGTYLKGGKIGRSLPELTNADYYNTASFIVPHQSKPLGVPGHLLIVALHGWSNFYSMLTGWKREPDYLTIHSSGRG